WAGKRGSEDADEAYREQVVRDSRRIASLAESQNVVIHYEYHGGTLTDTKESATRLLNEVNHQNIKTYWQPAVGEDVTSRLESIKQIKDWLSHVHVFHWHGTKRLPLSDGEKDWKQYINALPDSTDTRYAMLEFV